MHWFRKIADSDMERIKINIQRLESLRSKIHDLGFFTIASQSGGYLVLTSILEDQLVRGRPLVHAKLKSALIGENNQKIALDAPNRFQAIMVEAEELINGEIVREKVALKKLNEEVDDDKRRENAS